MKTMIAIIVVKWLLFSWWFMLLVGMVHSWIPQIPTIGFIPALGIGVLLGLREGWGAMEGIVTNMDHWG